MCIVVVRLVMLVIVLVVMIVDRFVEGLWFEVLVRMFFVMVRLG